MSKEKYCAVFSNLYPSDECVERIINMTYTKKKSGLVKPIIIAAAIASLLLIGAVMANALTDGKVGGSMFAVIDKLTSYPVAVTKDGEPVSEKEYKTEIYDKDGKHIIKVKTESGEVISETPYDEYEKNGSGDVFTESKYVDEKSEEHVEKVFVGANN